MKVTVVRGGGIAGVVLEVAVDTADLDDASAAELGDLVATCPFVDGEPADAPDAFTYEVVVERDDGTVVRARFGQGHAPAGTGPLLTWVLESPNAARTLGRPH